METLIETVYCVQPTGIVDSSRPNYVCRLNKSLYVLKQAPQAWYSCFASHITSLGFVEAKCDTTLFIFCRGADMAFLLLYIDDIVLTASSTSFLQQIILALHREFSMTDMGPLHHFLGATVERQDDSLFLSQRQYMLDILDRAGIRDCKPCSTPEDTHSKLSADGPSMTDPTHYRNIAGALKYLTFTRPDNAYAIQQVCLHMHDLTCTGPHQLILLSTRMLIGQAVLTPANPQRVMRCFSGTIPFLGHPSVSLQCPGPVRKLNITPLRMESLSNSFSLRYGRQREGD